MRINNKKIYKYTSIISLTIVIMLIGNLIVPMFTIADTGNSFRMAIEYNKEESILTLTGSLPTEYTSYNLYWATGTIPYEKPEDNATYEDKIKYMDDIIDWFTNNAIEDVISSDSTQINSTIKITDELTSNVVYNALCVAKTSDDSYAIAYASKVIEIPTVIDNTITITLNSENKKININVTDTSYDIKTIKIANSDVPLKCADFIDSGETLEFSGTRSINISKDVDNAGTYYVFAENTAGAQCVEGIVIRDEENNQNKIQIEMCREKNEMSKTIYIKAISNAGNITAIRYYISDQYFKFKDDQGNEITENINLVKNSENKLEVDGTKTSVIDDITNSDIGSNKYIGIYIKSTGYESYLIMPINNLEVVEGNPWIVTDPENPGETEELPLPTDPENPGETGETPLPTDPENPGETGESPLPTDPENPGETGETPLPTDPENPGETGELPLPTDPEAPGEIGESPLPTNPENPEETGESPLPSDPTDKTNITNSEDNKENQANRDEYEEISDKNSSSVIENADNDFPQTGSNDNFIILAIILFAIISLGSFAKYKTIK